MSNLVSGHNSTKLGGGPCCSQMLQGVGVPIDRLMDVHFRQVAGWTLWVKCGVTAGCVGCPVCITWPSAQPTTRLFVCMGAFLALTPPTSFCMSSRPGQICGSAGYQCSSWHSCAICGTSCCVDMQLARVLLGLSTSYGVCMAQSADWEARCVCQAGSGRVLLAWHVSCPPWCGR